MNKYDFLKIPDVLGYKSKGFVLSNEEEFKEYCREKFNYYKENVVTIEPIAEIYSDDEICSTNFQWGYKV